MSIPAAPRSRFAGGFTLVEVLVTLAIMGLVMLGLQVTLQSTVYTHDDLAIEMAKVREGPRILDMIERDIRSLHCFNIKDKAVITGESATHAGSRGDRIDLLTTRDSGRRFADPHAPWDEPQLLASDITEVGYRLRLREDGMSVGTEPLMELYRREDLYVDEDPMLGGKYELLHDRVLFFELKYYATLEEDADTEDDWDIKEKKALPAAIQVTLGLMPHSKSSVTTSYVDLQEAQNKRTTHRRMVVFNPAVNRSLAVRPARLVAIDENDVPAGGAGGAGGGGLGAPGEEGGMGEGGMNGGGDMGGDGTRGGRGGEGGAGGGSVMDGMPGGGGSGAGGGAFNGALRDGIFGFGDGFNLTDGENDLLDGWLDEAEDRFGN